MKIVFNMINTEYPTQNIMVYCKGAFNNYVDKMRGKGVKNVCFCPRSAYNNCPRRGAGRKWQNSVDVAVECPLSYCFSSPSKNGCSFMVLKCTSAKDI